MHCKCIVDECAVLGLFVLLFVVQMFVSWELSVREKLLLSDASDADEEVRIAVK